MDSELTNCQPPIKLLALKSPPTSGALADNLLYIAEKSGELLSFNLITKKKQRHAKEKVAITAIIAIQDFVLYGTRKGHIKALIDNRICRVATRHTSSIVHFAFFETPEGEIDLITASADSRIYIWKVILTTNSESPTPSTTTTPSRTLSLVFIKGLYGPDTPITSASLANPPTLFLCTAALSDTVRAFRLEKETQLLFKLPHSDQALLTLFLSANTFAVVSASNTLYLFNTDQVTPLHKLKASAFLPTTEATPVLLKSYHPSTNPSTTSTNSTHFILGFSTGHLFALTTTTNHKLKITGQYQHHAIPNDLLQVQETATQTPTNTNSNLYLLSGKEERHQRFIINKTFTNSVDQFSPHQFTSHQLNTK
ncbi:hypothetical protein NEHOM01_0118 [Nematocida homosporus]|uniref:uncharacterized protein n=1 Tax=Nematocida homosporus TaxID=1912981 RepID=UPI00221F1FC5|nr:uncharacterized protein NEHOM01_0118 [Nematocida homosporus]KAI5184373.1 hypothetical protein NEHOM01_0118 [Nematocida homosporus]